MEYKALYLHLFNAVTDAIEEIDRGYPLVARDLLVKAQQEAEEQYIQGE